MLRAIILRGCDPISSQDAQSKQVWYSNNEGVSPAQKL